MILRPDCERARAAVSRNRTTTHAKGGVTMSSAGPSEEIFRFSIVRNPVPASEEAREDGVIRIIPADADGERHPGYAVLLRLREGGAPRAEIVAQARKMMARTEFGDQLSALNTPIWRFPDRLDDVRDHGEPPTVTSRPCGW